MIAHASLCKLCDKSILIHKLDDKSNTFTVEYACDCLHGNSISTILTTFEYMPLPEPANPWESYSGS